MVAFVLIAAPFIVGCDRIVGPDEEAIASKGLQSQSPNSTTTGSRLAISTPILGDCIAKVYSNKAAPRDRLFLPIERFTYWVCQIDPESEQRWRSEPTMSQLIQMLRLGGTSSSRAPSAWPWPSGSPGR